MRLNDSLVAAVLTIALASGCVGENLPTLQEEEGEMQKSGSRIPAPTVDPVVMEGIRYEQIKNGFLAGFDQMGGYLAAYDAETGEQLWTLKVYDNKRDPLKEGDVQDVFFKTMTLQDDGTLLIENERGARFSVDVAGRTSAPLD